MDTTERYYFLKDKGLCTACGKVPPVKGVLCMHCRITKRRSQHNLRNMRRRKRLCLECEDPLVSGTEYTHCPGCREYHRTLAKPRDATRYAERKTRGLCVQCAVPLERGHEYVRCQPCLASKRAIISEKWRDIEGYEGAYRVSDRGRVKSLARAVKASGRASRMTQERVLKPIRQTSRYVLCREGSQSIRDVSRLVLCAFVGPPASAESLVVHVDGDSKNNRLINLKWSE